MERHWDSWGHLRQRYEKAAPRKILALDGGGIRGVISAEVLVRIEALLQKKLDKPELVLADYFDYIVGTSTGGIIAAALAIGMKATDVRDLYHRVGRDAFSKEGFFSRWKSMYQGGPLEQFLKKTFGETKTLSPEGLRTLLLIVTRNATTDSAWPISSNPHAMYNLQGRDYQNLLFPLWQVVRASSAAPTFFPPEVIAMEGKKGKKEFVFVDGGTTAYNNPAFLAYKMATEPRYELGWQSGEKNLLIVSVGSGSSPAPGPSADDPEMNLVSNALHTLRAVLSQAQVDQDMSCRMIGRCTYGGKLDREVADLIPVDAAGVPVPLTQDLGRSFLYARYDASLTVDGLSALGLHRVDPTKVVSLDAVDSIPSLQAIGYKLAEQVSVEHFGSFL